MEIIKKEIIKLRKNKLRLRSIWGHLRQKNKFHGLSDLILLNCIVEAIIELDLSYSSDEVYSAFKMVDKEDYERCEIRKILKPLLRRAKNRSVF